MSFSILNLWRNCFTCALVVGMLASYSPNPAPEAERTVELSNLVPFDELFAPPDTVILDPSVLVGQIWFIDADALGHLLITATAPIQPPKLSEPLSCRILFHSMNCSHHQIQ